MLLDLRLQVTGWPLERANEIEVNSLYFFTDRSNLLLLCTLNFRIYTVRSLQYKKIITSPDSLTLNNPL